VEIPLGNSIFQIQNFIVTGTSERKLRTCLLQLRQKETALKECVFRRRRYEIDLKELNEKLLVATGYERERLQIDVEELNFKLDSEIELINDCVIEIAVYRRLMEDLPKATRLDFENAEYEYWKERLLNDARREMTSTGSVSKGTIESLENMGIRVGRDTNNQLACEISTKQNNSLYLDDGFKKQIELIKI